MSLTASPEPDALPLFDRLGGGPALVAVIDRMFEGILADPLLRPFFQKTDMEWLKASQVDFFAQLLGGPMDYKGGPLRPAHAHLRIEPAHFDRFTGHLATALAEAGVAAPLQEQVLATVAPLRQAIVNSIPAQ